MKSLKNISSRCQQQELPDFSKTHSPSKKHNIAGRRLAMTTVAIATVTFTLAGCGPTKTPVAAPKLICNAGTPPGGFEPASSAARLRQTTATFPKLTGTSVDAFGEADALAAFQSGFSLVFNLNVLGNIYAPNLNKDPRFIPTLRTQLRSFSPYFCGAMRTRFLSAIPDIMNPTTPKKDAQGRVIDKGVISSWRSMFAIPDRLPDGRFLPNSTAASDLELVAPWSIAQGVGAPVVKLANSADYPGMGQVISFRFNWQNDLVYGTKKSILWYQPITRDITIYMAKNPDVIPAKVIPYVMVNFEAQAVTSDSFGTKVKYIHPLVEPAPA